MISRSALRLMAAGALVAATLALGGCGVRLDMHVQPKYTPLRESNFFSDHRSARPLVHGTVARGQLKADTYLYTGMVNGKPGTDFPFPVTKQVMERGRSRFNVYCSPCHGRTGDGNGIVVQRGFKAPPSYHIDRLRNAPVGHFFDVISNGFGAMADYSSQIPVKDRWAIIAYIRALQFSQDAKASDLPPGTKISSNPPNVNLPGSEPHDITPDGITPTNVAGGNVAK